MEVRHGCEACGELLAVHEHGSYSTGERLPHRHASAVRCVSELARMPFRWSGRGPGGLTNEL